MSLTRVRILQIPLDGKIARCQWINLPFASAIHSGFTIDESTYDTVFDGEMDVNLDNPYGALSELVEGLSINGRPIATSDIVVVDENWYYIGSDGFTLFSPDSFRS